MCWNSFGVYSCFLPVFYLPYAPRFNPYCHELIFSYHFQVHTRQTLLEASFILPMRLLPTTNFVIFWRIKYYGYKHIHIFHQKFITYLAKRHTLSSSSLQSKLHIIKNIKFKIDSSFKKSIIKEGKNRKNEVISRFCELEGTQAKKKQKCSRGWKLKKCLEL